jgi:hypothetical protein
MRGAAQPLSQAGPARSRDPWDEAEVREDDEPGPSWTKAYVGGVKVRQYTTLAAASAAPEPQQPSPLRGKRNAKVWS